MRKVRTELEDFFCNHLERHIKETVDKSAKPVSGVLDKPDFAVEFGGKRIAAELSQVPSSYIIRYFHRHLPAPTYKKDEILGRLIVYPFEPHRWVYEVIEKKSRFSETYKRNVGADELWLVMHSHSMKKDWPMSKPENQKQRKFELDLLRFGTKGRLSGFDKIIYIYVDGTVVTLLEDGTTVPKEIKLSDEDGFPAVTHHWFSLSFDVPLPGLGKRIYEFHDVRFQETILSPKDDWMRDRPPNIERPNFFVRAVVTSEGTDVELYRDGVKIDIKGIMRASSTPGQSYNFFCVLELGIRKQRYRTEY